MRWGHREGFGQLTGKSKWTRRLAWPLFFAFLLGYGWFFGVPPPVLLAGCGGLVLLCGLIYLIPIVRIKLRFRRVLRQRQVAQEERESSQTVGATPSTTGTDPQTDSQS